MTALINLSSNLLQVLERDPTKRLGCIEEIEPIRGHAFFKEIDWKLLESRKLRPPYKPVVVRKEVVWACTQEREFMHIKCTSSHVVCINFMLSFSSPE